MEFFHVDVTHSSQRLAFEMRQSARNAALMIPVHEKVVLDMLRVEGVLFRSNGRRGGGSWKPLAEKTVKEKGNRRLMRTTGSKPGYSHIGEAFENENTLLKSLSILGSPFQILKITNDRIDFGTTRPGAAAHQEGLGRLPQRRIINFLPEDLNRWNFMVAKHLLKPFHQLRVQTTAQNPTGSVIGAWDH